MAHLETWYRCPCGAAYDTQKEAIECAVSHVHSEQWAVGSKKAVRIFKNWASGMHSVSGALREADLSDFIEERKRQLAKMEEKNKCSRQPIPFRPLNDRR